eukprot:6477787-Amphidinium_carterae.1
MEETLRANAAEIRTAIVEVSPAAVPLFPACPKKGGFTAKCVGVNTPFQACKLQLPSLDVCMLGCLVTLVGWPSGVSMFLESDEATRATHEALGTELRAQQTDTIRSLASLNDSLGVWQQQQQAARLMAMVQWDQKWLGDFRTSQMLSALARRDMRGAERPGYTGADTEVPALQRLQDMPHERG